MIKWTKRKEGILFMKTIGFIGVGKMATAIISGLDKNKFKIIISGHNLTKTQKQAETLNVTAASNHEELVQESDFIILSVKPQVLPSVLSKLINHLTKDKTLTPATVVPPGLETLSTNDQGFSPLWRIISAEARTVSATIAVA